MLSVSLHYCITRVVPPCINYSRPPLVYYADGVDYFGPMPSVLTFTHTDSIQCANITIIDNFIFQEEREFVVTLVSDGNGLRVNANESAIHVTVVTDLTDGKLLHDIDTDCCMISSLIK